MSSLSFTFRVEPDGGEPFEVVARSRDIRHWEKITRGASITKISESPSMGDFYSLAYATAQRQGRFTGTLDDFENTCDLDLIAAVGEPDPSLPAPTRAG